MSVNTVLRVNFFFSYCGHQNVVDDNPPGMFDEESDLLLHDVTLLLLG